jgi:hypothetical protein
VLNSVVDHMSILLTCLVDCRVYNTSSAVPANGATATGASNNGTASTASSTLPSQSGKDYDFSSLTQGFFAKRWVPSELGNWTDRQVMLDEAYIHLGSTRGLHMLILRQLFFWWIYIVITWPCSCRTIRVEICRKIAHVVSTSEGFLAGYVNGFYSRTTPCQLYKSNAAFSLSWSWLCWDADTDYRLFFIVLYNDDWIFICFHICVLLRDWGDLFMALNQAYSSTFHIYLSPLKQFLSGISRETSEFIF